MFTRAALRAMFIALVTLPAVGALVASADDGPPRPVATGRPSDTVLRSSVAEWVRTSGPLVGGPARELVLLVGGLGSDPGDHSFDDLTARLASDPRYDVRRFGSDPAHPYDTDRALDPSARELVAEIRERAPGYGAVHIVTHSMGGAVVDQALGRGLSSRDGLRTIISLAPPRSGSTIARVSTGIVDHAGPEAPIVRRILSVIHDPATPSIRDLSRRHPAAAPPGGVTRLDLRLATDELVLSGDVSSAPDTDTRTLLPASLSTIEGHGGILRDPRALGLVTAAIAAGRAPPDERSTSEHMVTGAVSALDDTAVMVGLALAIMLLFAVIVALRIRRFILPVISSRLIPLSWSAR